MIDDDAPSGRLHYEAYEVSNTYISMRYPSTIMYYWSAGWCLYTSHAWDRAASMTCATSLSFFENLWCYSNNSTRSNTGITTKMIYYNQLQIYKNTFYRISSSVWPYGDIERIRWRLIDKLCSYDIHKRCYVASSYCTNEVEVIGWALLRYQKTDNRVIAQHGGYWVAIYSYDASTTYA